MSRFDYLAWDEKAEMIQQEFKRLVTNVENEIDQLSPSREKSLAYTALEEAYMWIGKAIRSDLLDRKNKT
jgi:hypothetical protein